QETGNLFGESIPTFNLSRAALRLGKNQEALQYSQEAVEISRGLQSSRLGQHLCSLGAAYASLGQLDKAIAALEEGLSLKSMAKTGLLDMELREAYAAILMTQQNYGAALPLVEEILPTLHSEVLDSADDPFLIYLTCYHVLQANQDERAMPLLHQAYQALLAKAQQIKDPDFHRSFLENVPHHRQLIEVYEASQGRPVHE
ncbi:MAG: tetratricopeptide repeat protein, partial [Chloroflexota bacterium]